VARPRTGTCELCKVQMSKPKMEAHVAECAPEHDASGAAERIVRVRVEARGAPRYWLLLEARGSATLKHLDALLRETWLECCGHMSAFSIGSSELPMGSKIGSALPRRRRGEFDYEYDFGSTTALRGQVLGSREGCLGRAPVRLLARNDALQWQCSDCARAAVIICPICIHEGDCLFCEAHAEKHSCSDEEVYLPVVNSPRMGVCGYVG
jgi:hypothetical protein